MGEVVRSVDGRMFCLSFSAAVDCFPSTTFSSYPTLTFPSLSSCIAFAEPIFDFLSLCEQSSA